MSNIYSRLYKIIPKIKEDKFIHGRGLGNEISFYIFDYEPEYELLVRDYVLHIQKELNYEDSNRKVLMFDLYDTLLEIAEEKGILKRIFEMEERQGKESLFKAMTTFAQPKIFLEKLFKKSEGFDVILITGVGKVYPFIRSHNILNNLQEVIDYTPVIMFFPGKYDGLSLRLFNKFQDDNYYRAFRLVD